MKRNHAFPGNYLAKDDVADPITAVVGTVNLEPVKCEHGDEHKPVMRFRNDQLKPLILNLVNWQTIEDAYGDDSDAWIGKPIEVYCDPSVMFGGRRVGGVRVRIPKQAPTRPQAPATPLPRKQLPAAAVAPMTALDAHKAILAGFATARSKAKCDEFAAWGARSYDFTPIQTDEQSDAYHAAMERLGVEVPAGVDDGVPF